MARLQSLARSEDFRKVMRTGSRVRRGGIAVYCCRSSEGPRLGLAVRARNSVVRNRIRRRLKEAFRRTWGAEPCHVVVRADESALSMDFQELEDMFQESLGGCGRGCA